jgi:hypothetical protein
MTGSLLWTIVIEGMIVLLVARWRNKPSVPILLTSVFGNLITQTALWVALNLFPNHYLPTLLLSEMIIWPVEGLLLGLIPFNQLGWREAFLLSLGMNAASFGIGCFLPI